ncbi:MAG: hypothetical protein KDJ52_04695 [Anaerolineae bacterium]|nr:hypothetical protein [Anaerolineae bacterium]
MKKFIQVVALIFPFLVSILLGFAMLKLIRPQPYLNDALNEISADLVQEESLVINNTTAYTVYIPIVVNPPLNLKKGFGAKSSPACDDLDSLKASWYFNWGPRPDSNCGPSNLEKFVPRIYNADSMGDLDIAIQNAQASGWLVGFSEPNLPWQGNVSPNQGAKLWRQIENAALPKGIKLVSPSPNQWYPGQNGQPYGHQWTWYMVDEYEDLYGTKPHFDALGWNIYKETDSEIKSFLNARRNEALTRGYDVPFWLLEYGGRCVNGSTSEIKKTMEKTTPWLNSTPWIGRYAWFANRITSLDSDGVDYKNCSLINSKGDLTTLGITYQGY